jgi:diguanylate cyclase (GGDEF)-like protein
MTVEGWERASRYLELETSAGTTDSFEVDVINASVRVIPVEIIAVPLLDGSDQAAGVQWTARDVTERRRLEKELVHLANQDHLTGLFNRRRFEEELSRATHHAVRTGRRGAVLWLDIDYFKEINDSLGHQAGDQVLIGLAATMRTQLRGDSVLARQGGDEFAVLLPEVSVRQAEECADRLINAIRKTSCVFHDRDLRVTTSMGIVMFPDHGTDAEEILARADLAMYQAKDGGRNRYRMYEPGEGWHTEQKTRFRWVSTIERALAEDLFVVHAQPVVNMATGEIDRHELLIRMEAENGDIVGPGEFLPTAERTGLIHEIDQWMVRRAVDLVSMQAGRDASYRLDVNLSGKAFSDPELLPLIQSELIRTGIEPISLGVEVTETAAIADMTKAREFITALRNLGCRVSLDDFGSGFSSFYYLKNLPVDCLKIDGGFVQDICNSTEDQHVVKAIVELAQGFGVTSTAEFVEDQATFEMLRSLGVTYAQGYHIARPIPVERLGGSGARRTAEGA